MKEENKKPKGCAAGIIVGIIIGIIVAILTSGGDGGAFSGIMWGIAAACGSCLIISLIIFASSSDFKETNKKNLEEINEEVTKKVAHQEKERIAEENRKE